MNLTAKQTRASTFTQNRVSNNQSVIWLYDKKGHSVTQNHTSSES